jgi:putative endonuclease
MSLLAGKNGETEAARYLSRKGYKIIRRNFLSRYGEIDIIATAGKYIVFVEVKARSGNPLVPAEESVTEQKRGRVKATALIYLQKNPTELQPRFDVVIVKLSGNSARVAEHFENAF